MQGPVEAPTPQALADLVARCKQIARYAVQLTEAEETRIAALASGILAARGVLELEEIDAARLPARQGRIRHWALTGGHLSESMTPAMKHLHGTLVLDEHEQIKILSRRTWRGAWRVVTLWRDGVHGCSAHDLMEYLARLAAEAQRRAPAAARTLLERSKAIAATKEVSPTGPRARAD
jgi:hypothetical protein